MSSNAHCSICEDPVFFTVYSDDAVVGDITGLEGAGDMANINRLKGAGDMANIKGLKGADYKANIKGLKGAGDKANIKELEGEGDKAETDPCFEKPKVMGNCYAAIPKWSFANGRCEKFTYGGCGGTRELLHLHVGLLPGL